MINRHFWTKLRGPVRTVICFSAAITIAGAVPGYAENGVWTPTQNFAREEKSCIRIYTCGPGADIMHNASMSVVPSPPKLVWGVCSAGNGPLDSCKHCLAPPPKERCEWHLEKRK